MYFSYYDVHLILDSIENMIQEIDDFQTEHLKLLDDYLLVYDKFKKFIDNRGDFNV